MSVFSSNNTPKKASATALNQAEIELLLVTIKNSTFKGEELDTLYKAVVKLQTQYNKLSD